MSELQPDNPSDSPPVEQDPKPADVSSRRSILSKNIKRAAYIAPIVWSVSARTALAKTATGGGGPSGPPE